MKDINISPSKDEMETYNMSVLCMDWVFFVSQPIHDHHLLFTDGLRWEGGSKPGRDLAVLGPHRDGILEPFQQ